MQQKEATRMAEEDKGYKIPKGFSMGPLNKAKRKRSFDKFFPRDGRYIVQIKDVRILETETDVVWVTNMKCISVLEEKVGSHKPGEQLDLIRKKSRKGFWDELKTFLCVMLDETEEDPELDTDMITSVIEEELLTGQFVRITVRTTISQPSAKGPGGNPWTHVNFFEHISADRIDPVPGVIEEEELQALISAEQ
jgi:hypothetical protein